VPTGIEVGKLAIRFVTVLLASTAKILGCSEDLGRRGCKEFEQLRSALGVGPILCHVRGDL
jgi:hypothetical protein